MACRARFSGALALDQDDLTTQDVVDHRTSYEAVRDRDPAQARHVMLEHLQGPTVAQRIPHQGDKRG